MEVEMEISTKRNCCSPRRSNCESTSKKMTKLESTAGSTMDAEAALLECSPTLSVISSPDLTESKYPDGGPPFSSDEREILTSARGYTKVQEENLTPTLSPRHSKPPNKPKLRIRLPYLMICVSIIEISVHCLGEEATLRTWLVYDPQQRIQAWRFASYMLLHSNALHLSLNVVIQLVLAVPLEVEQGWLGVAAVYLGGGICGALGASLLQPTLYLVGASAGVYALLTSHLAHLYLCHGELPYPNWRLGAILLLAGADVVSLPVPALLGCGRVGWAAHVAGAIAGPLLGLALFPRQSKKDSRGRKFVRFVRFLAGLGVLLLIFGAILGNIYLIALPQQRRAS
ncbi:protein rhomboid-like isoform X1 [Neodiprion virginianus]|uniref:protein rhomboid-like isoform X1 n=1 Tax=Neodiprion virginianus TaxID=2961670 RepID=UPI001EE6E874|nr:protein rhomboid-like isoform X1 [Neodiprion virginianus]